MESVLHTSVSVYVGSDWASELASGDLDELQLIKRNAEKTISDKFFIIGILKLFLYNHSKVRKFNFPGSNGSAFWFR